VNGELSDGDRILASRCLIESDQEMKVVFIPRADGDTEFGHAIDAGCSGILSDDPTGAEVISVIRAAASGESMVSTKRLASFVKMSRHGVNTRSDLFVARELQVLELLAKGNSTDQIRDELFLSRSTVRNYIRSILAKLGARSRLEAVTIAQRYEFGIVSPDCWGLRPRTRNVPSRRRYWLWLTNQYDLAN
jgi:DNA-binding NarL/FixJ family response regulator